MDKKNDDGFFEEGYQVPKNDSPFMKLEQGENVIRILDKPLMGYSGWKLEKDSETGKEVNVPYRFPLDQKPEDVSSFKNNRINHFWALPVWNYSVEKVQVLEITQKTIQREIHALGTDPDWGNPSGFDIKIKKEGEKLETEYTVTPKPHTETPAEAEVAWAEVQKRGFDLNKLMKGESPFAKASDK